MNKTNIYKAIGSFAFGIALVVSLYLAYVWMSPVLMSFAGNNGYPEYVALCERTKGCREVEISMNFDEELREPVFRATYTMRGKYEQFEALHSSATALMMSKLDDQYPVFRLLIRKKSLQVKVENG